MRGWRMEGLAARAMRRSTVETRWSSRSRSGVGGGGGGLGPGVGVEFEVDMVDDLVEYDVLSCRLWTGF
jgi:hypothetical protein